MLGQGGNYGPQFRPGQLPLPPPPPSSVPPPALPPFQQANSQMVPPPPPSFQQANFRVVPPPPPSFCQATNPTGQAISQGLPPSMPVQYQPGLPAPPSQPTPPQGMMGLGQPLLHHSYPSQPQLYASPITTNSFTTPAPLPNRGPPPPPSLSQGQALYRPPLPPSPGTHHVLPPPPAPSIASTNAPPYISFGCRPLDHGLTPALPPSTPPDPPPPPPPLVPSSPPPLPTSPPPPTSAANNVMDSDSKLQAVNQETNDGTTGKSRELLIHNDSQVSNNNVGKVSSTSGGDDLSVIPSPSPSVKARLPPLSVSVDKVSPVPAADSDMDMGDDEYSFCEDLSAPNSPFVTGSTKEVAVLESAKSTTSEARPSVVMSPIHSNKDEDSPRVVVNVGNPFTHIQGYASDDSSEDDLQKFNSDVSPVRHSPKSASITLTSHVEMFDMHSTSEATQLVTGSMQHASSVSVEIDNAPVTKYPSQDEKTRNFMSSTHIEGTEFSSVEAVSFAPSIENDRIDNLVCHPQNDCILGEKNVNSDALHQYSIPEQGEGDAHHQDRAFHSEEDAKEVSLVQRVDEFGRMVREGVSDSDSDGMQYDGISGSRGRSSSRSHILGEENLSSKALHRYTTSEHAGGDAHHRDRAFHSEMDAKECSSVKKVDEFGRMVREGVSDSDSDGMRYRGRRGKRGRSSSRSLSPREDRWRSRGHWRRKEIRSKSRSWSPKRVRVRSKSPPSHWHYGEFVRGHTEATKCIYFLRGWCKHGTSCRYLHEHGRNRSKAQKYRGVHHDSDRYDVEDHLHEVYEGNHDLKNKGKESVICDNISKEVKTYEEFQSRQDKSVNSIHDPVLVSDSMQIKDADNDRMKSAASHSQCLEEVGEEEHGLLELTKSMEKEKALSTIETENHHFGVDEGTLQNLEVLNNTSNNKIQSDTLPVNIDNSHSETTDNLQTCKNTLSPHSLVTSPVRHQGSQSNVLQQQHTEGSSMCHSSDAVPAETFPCQSAAKPSSEEITINQPRASLLDQPFRNQTPANQPLPEHMHVTESCTSIISTSGHQFHPQSTLPFAVRSAPPYTLPIPMAEQFASSQQNSLGSGHHSVYPSQNSWSNIGHPPYYGGASVPAHNPEFDISHHTQNRVPPSQFQSQPSLRPPANNHYGGQPSYPLVSVDIPFSSGLPRYPEASHLHPTREDIKAPFQQQNIVSSSFTHGSGSHTESSFDKEPFARQIQSFPRDNMALGAFSKEDVHDPTKVLTYPHQHPVAGSQKSAGGVFPSSITASNITGPPCIGHSTSFPENSLMPRSTSSGLPKIPAAVHYNPFASTFEKQHGPSLSALDSKIAGIPFAGADKKFPSAPSGEFPYHLHQQEPSIEVAAGTQKQHGKEASASDPYDPLFDSIDGSSYILKRFNHIPNNDTAGVQVTNFGSDEVGETATDAEAGAVEDGSPLPGIGLEWSPGIQVDPVNRKGGELDIERLPSQGNSKKSKDSRSVKLFRIAVANFVKEVLKPSWRQGNMSKEAFKTIVKKTVDKVSSTMPSHRIPKSQAKIDQYVESSQRKLTKLVMGYVEKYVKV